MKSLKKISFYRNRQFYLIASVCFLFFAVLFKFEYATDTYKVAQSISEYGNWALATGRPINALFFYTMGAMNASIYATYYVSLSLSIVFIIIGIYQLYLIFKNNMNPWLAVMLALLLILNPFVIEYFLFIEKGLFALGIMLTIIAIKQFIKIFASKYLSLIPCVICEIVVAFIYQPFLSLFATMSIFMIAFNIKKIKPFVIFTLIAIGVFAISASANLIFMKVYPYAERSSSFDISNIFRAMSIAGLPVAIILIVFGLIMVSVLAYLKFKYRNDGRKYYHYFFAYLYLLLGTIAAVFIPFAFTDPKTTTIAYRTIYPFMVLVALVGIEFAYQIKKVRKNNPYPLNRKQLIPVIACIAVEFAFLQTIFISRIINNTIDEQEIRLIGQLINQYEEKSATKITKLSFYRDDDSHFAHQEALSLGINFKAFMTDWSDVNSVNWYLSAQYQKVENDNAIYNHYFKDYRSNSFDANKQLVFINDTLHIYVY